jgi:hypothetical protein
MMLARPCVISSRLFCTGFSRCEYPFFLDSRWNNSTNERGKQVRYVVFNRSIAGAYELPMGG